MAPAAYRSAAAAGEADVARLTVWISLVLLAVYAANLAFSLVTHAALFAGSHEVNAAEQPAVSAHSVVATMQGALG